MHVEQPPECTLALQRAYLDAVALRHNVFYLALVPSIFIVILVSYWQPVPEKRQSLGRAMLATAASKAAFGIVLIFLIPHCPIECLCVDQTFANLVYVALCFVLAFVWARRGASLLDTESNSAVAGVPVGQVAVVGQVTASPNEASKAMV